MPSYESPSVSPLFPCVFCLVSIPISPLGRLAILLLFLSSGNGALAAGALGLVGRALADGAATTTPLKLESLEKVGRLLILSLLHLVGILGLSNGGPAINPGHPLFARGDGRVHHRRRGRVDEL